MSNPWDQKPTQNTAAPAFAATGFGKLGEEDEKDPLIKISLTAQVKLCNFRIVPANPQMPMCVCLDVEFVKFFAGEGSEVYAKPGQKATHRISFSQAAEKYAAAELTQFLLVVLKQDGLTLDALRAMSIDQRAALPAQLQNSGILNGREFVIRTTTKQAKNGKAFTSGEHFALPA